MSRPPVLSPFYAKGSTCCSQPWIFSSHNPADHTKYLALCQRMIIARYYRDRDSRQLCCTRWQYNIPQLPGEDDTWEGSQPGFLGNKKALYKPLMINSTDSRKARKPFRMRAEPRLTRRTASEEDKPRRVLAASPFHLTILCFHIKRMVIQLRAQVKAPR